MNYLVPALLLLTSALALRKTEEAYDTLLKGGAEGLRILVAVLPTLVMLMTAVTMLRESGALTLMGKLLSPALSAVGIPPETALLMLIRPISGSAALAVGSQLMAQYGPESRVGITAAVMLGATETTFYTIGVYFGAAGIRRTRYTVPVALTADLIGFLSAAWTVRLLFPEAQ